MYYLDGIWEMLDIIKKVFSDRKTKKEAKKYKVESEPVDPKTAATSNKEPWVAVLETHVNPKNPKNGFFDLDWNEYFITMLRQNGYTGVSEEEIVDQWFSELCRSVGSDENLPGMDRRGFGYINRALRDDGKTEVS